MSVILKKPAVNLVLESCTTAQLDTIRNIIDGVNLSDPTKITLIAGHDNTLSESYKGITYVDMEIVSTKKHAIGILVYNDTYCALFVVNGEAVQCMDLLFIENNYVKDPHERLTINEFRRVLDEKREHGGDEWVDRVKPHLDYTNNALRIEGDLVVDGELQVKKDVTIGSSEALASATDLDIYGNITATGTGAIGSNLSVGGDLTVTGGITMSGGQLNAFATQGIFSTLQAYLGVDSARFGQAITESDFYENKNENVTISNFSAYKVGQFVFVVGKCESGNCSAYTSIFKIKEAYRPKIKGIQSIVANSNHWGNTCVLTNNNDLVNIASTTDTDGYCYFSFIYEIA